MKIPFFSIALIAVLGSAAYFFTNTGEKQADNSSINWTTDYQAAIAQAKKEKKEVLLNFTGSDWCGWCKKLSAEVFDQPDFVAFANENLVCVTLDFPRRTPISNELRQQNGQLAQKHGIRGYPTILILNQAEEVLLRTGYQRGGPENYINHLKPYVSL